MLITLNVDYKERFIVKKSGAKWNAEIKKWQFNGERIPLALIPYISNMDKFIDSIKKDSLKKFTDGEKDKFAMLDNAKYLLFDSYQKIAFKLLSAVTNPTSDLNLISNIPNTDKSILTRAQITTGLQSIINKESVEQYLGVIVNKEHLCQLSKTLTLTMRSDAFNVIKKSIWVDNKNIDAFTSMVNEKISYSDTYVEKYSKVYLQDMVKLGIKKLEVIKRTEIEKQYDFLLAYNVNSIDVDLFVKNNNSITILGLDISIAPGRKTIDINRNNIIHLNGNLALKLFECKSVRSFSKKLIGRINQHKNKLCNNFMNDGVEKTTVESGMWFSVSKSKSVAKGFMQRGEWFIDVIDGINIDAETGAAKKLVSIIKKSTSS